MDAGAEEPSDAAPRAQNLDPGPVDKSVLVEQELHKSQAIFDGKIYKPVRFIEHGTRLNQWEVRHEGMLALLKRSGFYHLSLVKRVQLDHALLNALVERWRRETQTFHLRFGEMTVLLKDVAILSGLRVDGDPVTGPTDCHWEQLCLQLLGQEPPQIKGGSINIAWLHYKFANIPEGADQSDIEYAARAYILYQIGCSLFPDPSGTRVHLRYLALLRDFDASGKMAWGAAVLAHLYRELGKASMKGKANCCAFLTLLQIWAWEHIQIGSPERLENKTLPSDHPLGCRWNGPFKNRENVRSMDHEFYRHGLDTISDCQITWDPYKPNLIAGLPAICTFGSAVWRSRTPLICFQIVEMHVPDRVLLQFGMLQHIPDPVEAVERVTMQGKADQDWSTYHDKYIKLWENRLSSVIKPKDVGNSDPTQARNCYLEWYWQITRRWISTPVEYPIISYQLSGKTEKVLVDLVTTVQGRIKTLLSSEIDARRMKESLSDIDMYITSEMEKAKQVAQNDVPAGMGIGSLKSATVCSSVNRTQGAGAKMEHVVDDHVEGHTILQLDQMKRIQRTSGTPNLASLTIDASTNNQTEDMHLQEDPIDVTMTEVNLRDIITTPVEDAVNEIMNTSTEGPKLDSISDSEVKNGYTSVEIVDSNKVFKKVMAELQESASAPLINGKVDEVISVFMDDYMVEITHMDSGSIAGQGTVQKPSEDPELYKVLGVPSHNEQLLKITDESENDGTIENILDTRTENSSCQGVMGQPLNAIELGETLNTSRDKSMRAYVEPSSGCGQETNAVVPGHNELQHAFQTQPVDNVIEEEVDAVQNPFFREKIKDPIEHGSLNPAAVLKPVAICPEDLLIASAGERTQRNVDSLTGEATDTNVRKESTGEEDHVNPGPNEISKRRKLMIRSHEIFEIRSTVETTIMVGNGKTKDGTHQTVRSGNGQLIAFTRRKRKDLCNHCPDS